MKRDYDNTGYYFGSANECVLAEFKEVIKPIKENIIITCLAGDGKGFYLREGGLKDEAN